MRSLRLPALALVLFVLGSALSGCALHTTSDSSVPWAQPASWEGQVPGMSSPGSGGVGH